MNPELQQFFSSDGVSARRVRLMTFLLAMLVCALHGLQGAEAKSEPAWRSLPLIADGQVDPVWMHVGWGGFIVDEGVLRTDPHPKGLGLLVYFMCALTEGFSNSLTSRVRPLTETRPESPPRSHSRR